MCGQKLEPLPPKNPFSEVISKFDNFLAEEFQGLNSYLKFSYSEFLAYANEVSDRVHAKVEEIIQFASVQKESPFYTEFVNQINDKLSKTKMDVWSMCDEAHRLQEKDNMNHTAQNGFDSMSKIKWGEIKTRGHHISRNVYLGHSEIRHNIFERTISFNVEQRCELMNKTNLIVRFDSGTEKTAMGIVSSLAGRWLKASLGHGFQMTILDTLSFWGLGSSFNKLKGGIYNLICDKHDASIELEKMLQYEQSIIQNKLSADTPSVEKYNLTHKDIIPQRLLVIKNFPSDVSSGLDTLQLIMRNSAQVGLCVILMVNEDEARRMSFNRTGRDADIFFWNNFAEEFDLTKNRFSILPEGSSLIPEILEDDDLAWIIKDVNEAIMDNGMESHVQIIDYVNQIDEYENSIHNLSLLVGTAKDTFAQQFITLDDMSIGNSIRVCGALDSLTHIYNWMEAVAIYALSRYSPEDLLIVFCDFSDKNLFSSFEGKLKNVIVWRKPKARSIFSFQTHGRQLIFAAGLNSLDEKELLTLANAPFSMNPGTHLIIEDTLGVLPIWQGQQLLFGPNSDRDMPLSEFEFILGRQICRRVGIESASINVLLSAILEKHPNLKPNPDQDEITDSDKQVGPNLDGPLFLRNFLPAMERRWSASSSKSINIPIGINPWNERTIDLEISQTSAQNAAFIIGKPGTGKSSLLHTIILNASYLYSPDKLHMYLVDMSGVEFQFYATSNLPHAKVIAPQAEREFALCVLDEIEAEAVRREKLFFENGIKDFSNATGIPRILIIIDEFQVFFELDDDISSRAKDAIDRIVKKYRKFGINLILATQRLPSSSCLDYSLINNRIAFDCIPDNFTTLFGPSNRQPLLGKGECLYTSKGKLLASIQENHVKSFFADVDRTSEDGVKEVERLVRGLDKLSPGRTFEPAKVFIKDKEVFFSPERMSPVLQEDYPEEVNIYLGEPISIDNDVRVTLENSAFDNILILGGHQEVAQGIAINAVLSAADAYTDSSATCYVVSFSKRKSILYGSASEFLCGYPYSADSANVPREDFITFLQEIGEEVTRRQKDYSGVYKHIFILFLDYQNSGIDRQVEKNLEFILSNGPQVSIYSIMQASGIATLKGRTKVDMFNHRVALQMSFEDSRVFIDKKWAGALNDLTKETSTGLQRAYYYNNSNSLYVKFKPYSYKSLILNTE